jgi:chromosome segregation ATPase
MDDLVAKFQELKNKHTELIAERVKYEARREQLKSEIENIQSKYTSYDLSTVKSVDKIIKTLTNQLENELKD